MSWIAGIWTSVGFTRSASRPRSLSPGPGAISSSIRLHSLEVDKATAVLSDQIITLRGFYSRQGYPDRLRRIRFFDADRGKRLVFLTNNFASPAQTIAQLYRCRWQVELFFKWIKQHLRIKAFYGTTANALKTQIWIAISVYLLVAIVKKKLAVKASLHKILQIVSVTIFEKTPILQAFSDINLPDSDSDGWNQLNLFNERWDTTESR